MTLEEIIEEECRKSGSSYFHMSEIENIFRKHLKSLTEKELLDLYKLVKNS